MILQNYEAPYVHCPRNRCDNVFLRRTTTNGVTERASARSVPRVTRSEPRNLAQRTLVPRTGVTDLGLGELRHHRDLLFLFVRRELKLRYTQTVLGPLWVLLNPLLPAVVFSFIFTRVVHLETGPVHYLLLVTTAMIPWTTFSRSLTRGGGSLIAERNLLTKVYFPRLLIPLAIVLSSVADLLVSLAVALAVFHGSGARLTPRLVLLPVLIVWTLALSFGVTVAFAGLSVRRRDLINALPFVTQVLLYASPVAFPLFSVPIGIRNVMRWNPIASLVEAFQWALSGRTAMPLQDLAIGLGSCAAIVLLGLMAFSVGQRAVADVL